MSSYDLAQVQRVRLAVESATFGADLTNDIATNFFDLRHEPTDLVRATPMVEDTTVVQRAFQRRNDVRGPDRATMQLSCMWTGTNQALDSSTSATKRNQSKVLEALLGGYNAAQGSAVEASPSPTTTGCTVTTGHGSRFTPGTIIALVVSGTVYPRYVTTVSTDAITWWPALPAAPAAASTVYNSQSIFFTDQPATQLQALAEVAKQRGNIWLGLGSQGDFTLDLTRGQLAKWGTTLDISKWKHDDEMTTPIGGQSIAVATYDDSGPIVAFRGGCHFGPTGSTALATVSLASVSFGFGRAWLEVGKHDGFEGRDEPQLNTRDQITCELTLLQSDPYEDYHDAWSAETDYGLLLWLDGGAAGAGRAICMPTMQIRKPPEPAEAFGMKGLKISGLVKESTLCADQSTEVRRSPVVLGHY